MNFDGKHLTFSYTAFHSILHIITRNRISDHFSYIRLPNTSYFVIHNIIITICVFQLILLKYIVNILIIIHSSYKKDIYIYIKKRNIHRLNLKIVKSVSHTQRKFDSLLCSTLLLLLLPAKKNHQYYYRFTNRTLFSSHE